MTIESLRHDLGKFGPIDQVRIVADKNIGFVHFLTITNAIKAVQQLPSDPAWLSRKVYYGRDRCAYVSKQQQNVQQHNQAILGSLGYAAMSQVSPAVVGTYTAGQDANYGNRTVYLGNIHPETTLEEICNVVRGGILHHIRYIPEKHICFVTFIDPNSAITFFGLSNMQGLLIHNRRLKIGWGKHSGPLPTQIALAVGAGASRNVYVGNIEEGLSEEQLKADFSEFGEIELVNTLREKSCAFVNFTNLASAIKAIEGIKNKDGYKDRYRINFGKDRCGSLKNRATGNGTSQQNLAAQHSIGVHNNISPGNLISNGAQLQDHSGLPNVDTAGTPESTAAIKASDASTRLSIAVPLEVGEQDKISC